MAGKGLLVVNLLCALFWPCWSQCGACADSTAPGEWTSRVNAVVRGPLDAATNTATQFVSWRADRNLPPGGQYVVATRIRFSAEANWNISQPTDFMDWFVLRLLPYKTRYDVLVCYANVTLSTLPAPGTNGFVPECGLCRACFRTSDAPTLSITEATIEDNFHEPNVQYECVAVGIPSNISFVWYAENTQNNSIRVAIPDSMVETSTEDGKTESELELKRDGGKFENPSCTASNGVVTRTINPRDFETRKIGILGATMQVVGSSMVYRCEAIGQPLNEVTVSWDARRSGRSSSMRVRIPDDDSIVSTRRILSLIVSTLTLDEDSEFSEPRCTAMLGDDHDFRDLNANFEEIQIETVLEMTTNALGVVGKSDVHLEAIIPLILVPVILTPLGVFFGFMCYRRYHIIHKKRKRKEEAAEVIRSLPLQHVSNGGYDQSIVKTSDEPENNNTTTESRPVAELRKKLPDDLIIDPTDLKVSVVIGQGEFGVIYKAHYYQRDERSVVAVKTLKGLFTTAGDIENAIKEILKMYRFNHPNVMSLVGVCMDPSDQGSSAGPSMVMPFMAKGSLLEYLRKEANHLKATAENEIPKVRMPLLQICQQIAKGMEYLSGLNFVHRDLAARNCLMDASGVIKVSDFGLAENLYSRNYFREVKDGAKLPIKWMALESIRMVVFTEKSDVWSYGVTVWEVFTGGSIPYPGLHPREVLDFLESGHRLKRPKNMACCPILYKHMLDMWHEQPESRPTFSTIVQTFEHFMAVTSNYLDLGSAVSANPSNASGEDERREQMSLGSFSEGDEITSLSGDGMNRHSILGRVASSPNDYTFAGDMI